MTSLRPRPNRRARAAAAVVAALAAAVAAVPGVAGAVNAQHGNQVVTDDPANWTPHAMNGSVIAMVQVGNRIVAAGTFTSVSPGGIDSYDDTSDDMVRNRIFAFDATTGAIDTSFNPNLGGGPVTSLDTDGSAIYAAGSFKSVGGNTSRKRVVKLNLDGSVDTTFRAVPNSVVNEVVVRGGRVYIGGAFTSIKRGAVTTQRGHLAALNPATGEVLPAVNLSFSGIYDPSVGGSTTIKRFDLTSSGDKMVVVGNFTAVNGQPRQQITVLDTGGATAQVLPWSTDRYSLARSNCANAFDNPLRDVDISADGSFFVVTTTGAFAGGANANTLCDTVARWEMSSSAAPTWVAYTGGDTSYGVAIAGGAVYVGGHFRWLNNPYGSNVAGPGAVPRSGIAALDVVNGLPLSWNPGRTRGVGAQSVGTTDAGLWVGSDTFRFKNEKHGRIAFLPLANGTAIPADAPYAALPNTLFGAGGTTGGTGLRSRTVGANGSPTGTSTAVSTPNFSWSGVRGAFYLDGEVYYGTSGGGFKRRTFNPATGALGAEVDVPLYNNGGTTWSGLNNVTGMFYEPTLHRIYYTVSGQTALYYRYFTPESRVVGAQQFTAANPSAVNFSQAGGVTLAGGRILFGNTANNDGKLRSAPFANGGVTGAASEVSTENAWNFRALFVPHA